MRLQTVPKRDRSTTGWKDPQVPSLLVGQLESGGETLGEFRYVKIRIGT